MLSSMGGKQLYFVHQYFSKVGVVHSAMRLFVGSGEVQSTFVVVGRQGV